MWRMLRRRDLNIRALTVKEQFTTGVHRVRSDSRNIIQFTG